MGNKEPRSSMDTQTEGVETIRLHLRGNTRGKRGVSLKKEEATGRISAVQESVRSTLFFKKSIVAVLAVLATSSAYAHPDGATPYWYPSSYIYGFINGCSKTIEVERIPIIEKLWPDEVRSVCGCVFDSIRHSLTYRESLSEDKSVFQLIVNSTMPVCMDEELNQKK